MLNMVYDFKAVPKHPWWISCAIPGKFAFQCVPRRSSRGDQMCDAAYMTSQNNQRHVYVKSAKQLQVKIQATGGTYLWMRDVERVCKPFDYFYKR